MKSISSEGHHVRVRGGVCASLFGLFACTAQPTTPNDAGAGGVDGGELDAGQVEGPFYYGEVQAILQKNCEGCHYEGGPAGIDFVGFDNAQAWSTKMGEMVAARKMPPWGAFDTDSCKPRLPWKDDLRLPDGERASIMAWASHGAPPGDEAKALTPKAHPQVGLDRIDQTLAPPNELAVPAGDQDLFRCFVLDYTGEELRFVNGVDIKPGNKAVVHHAIVFTDPDGQSPGLAGPDGSYDCFGGPNLARTTVLTAWAPGSIPLDLGESLGIPLERGTRLVLQIHYHPTFEDQKDRSSVELRFNTKKPIYEVAVSLIGNFAGRDASTGDGLQSGMDDRDPNTPEFRIPAGARGHVEELQFTMPRLFGGFPLPELRLVFVGTHMHYVGTGMRIELERPDNDNECLIETPQWDFRWQRGYGYDATIDQIPVVKAGDVLKMTCTYDNSLANPYVKKALTERGKTEPEDVYLGEQTLDEMCLGVFGFAYPARLF